MCVVMLLWRPDRSRLIADYITDELIAESRV
jgi:hypothetical protein